MPASRSPKPLGRSTLRRETQPRPQRKPTNENGSTFEDGIKTIQSRHDRSRDKALIIAIEKYPTKPELSTPHQDARRLEAELRSQGIKNIHVLRENHSDPYWHPTRANVIRELFWLKTGVESGDVVVLYLAGHAEQVVNTTGTESDGKDEAFVTVDPPQPGSSAGNNLIIDNDLRRILVNSLVANSYLIAILDVCHSETLLDLDSPRKYRQVDFPPDKDPDSPSSPTSGTRANSSPQVMGPSEATHSILMNSIAATGPVSITGQTLCQPPVPLDRRGFAYVLSIAACHDGQKAWAREKPMIQHLLRLLKKYKDNPLTPRELETKLRKKMYKARKSALQSQVIKNNGVWDHIWEQKVQDLQQPKITTWRDHQQLLDIPFTALIGPLTHRSMTMPCMSNADDPSAPSCN